MILSRRWFLQNAGAVAAPLAAPQLTRAQAYPSRPVRIVVGFPPGGPTDIAARLVGQWLSDRLGQQFIVENRPGAVGNVGTEAVVRAPSDGYTLLLAASANAINATLYGALGYDFIRDITPVASIARFPLVMEVNPSLPVRTVPEFIAYAKANPGKINMASGGNGSPQHVAGELFKMMAGIDMLHVPYRGAAPALADLIGGQVQVMFDPLSSSIEQIKAGKLRALAVATAMRSEALPEIPTVGDFLPGYEASYWCGVGLPRNAPAEIVDELNREINAGLADHRMLSRIAELGGTAIVGSPTDFRKLIATETEKWAKVVKFSGAGAE
jgi:tripartite-type tricarboxylate transporter receptor subunit TctC